ncbi:lipopolysaccharide biosynthesis protein [Vibrio porteresiae]|uniref:Lipopolysaccharide biosynthesis protein n=1 Tax=Vibrio porteresiae DSM 19223 TaxID=1123496 RepID=A0ABZ0QCT7_9VIBR|nr:lipopolysaccharide biosynthesis protein [Vibrio porteresiae]WPC74278.1 lipopolysaccharide biosynthesis protein [Vibrio porteresiae DSM 19223]
MNQTVEKKFKHFRESITSQQFDDVEFLKSKAQDLQSTDMPLAERILVRVKNLENKYSFDRLKERLTKEQWNDIEFLLNEKRSNTSPFLKSKLDERIEILNKLNQTSKTTSLEEGQDKNRIEEDTTSTSQSKYSMKNFKKWMRQPFFIIVVLPTIVFSFYQLVIASDRYQSQAQVIVQQPDASTTLDTSMAILSGLGVGTSSGSDPQILKAYIYSSDMVNYLDEKVHLKEHYTSNTIDIFSRLIFEDKESFLNYYKDHITVEIDSTSGIISIYAQGFTPQFANQLVETIVKRSEWYINSIGHQLAEAQLDFVKKEHANIEQKLKTAQSELLTFQQKYNLLDPTAEGAALQQIAYTLEGQITAKEAELKTARHIMTESAPRVLNLKQEISGLRMQLENERNKLATRDKNDKRTVGDILAKFADLKVDNELALQAYTSSQVSLEKSRIETYRQLKYLVVVENPTQPDDNEYPDIPYNITLFFIIFSMSFGVGRILYLTVQELK